MIGGGIRDYKKNFQGRIKMIKKYRKKPIIIYASQWSGDFDPFINDFSDYALYVSRRIKLKDKKLIIETLEGVMTADISDWIIIGVNGELYPCKDDIFKKTYDKVEEEK